MQVQHGLHPYYPTDIKLPNYIPNDATISANATHFSVLWVLLLGSSWILLINRTHGLNLSDKLTCLWFIFCGTLHCFFEGYFVLNYSSLSMKQDLCAQLWKEYSLSDSRYLTGDSLVLAAEFATVIFWGPLSYVAAICTLRLNPWRYPVQAIVSLAHIYGDTLYISTSLLELFSKGVSHSRPEALYFWFYFLFLNGIWLVIPAGKLAWSFFHSLLTVVVLLYQSSAVAAEAITQVRKADRMPREIR